MPRSPQMPRDGDGAPIPVLGFRPGGARHLAVSAASAVVGPFDPDTRVVGLICDVPVHINLGDTDVTATAADHYLPAGQWIDLSLGGGKHPLRTHLAAVAAGDAGLLHVSERE